MPSIPTGASRCAAARGLLRGAERPAPLRGEAVLSELFELSRVGPAHTPRSRRAALRAPSRGEEPEVLANALEVQPGRAEQALHVGHVAQAARRVVGRPTFSRSDRAASTTGWRLRGSRAPRRGRASRGRRRAGRRGSRPGPAGVRGRVVGDVLASVEPLVAALPQEAIHVVRAGAFGEEVEIDGRAAATWAARASPPMSACSTRASRRASCSSRRTARRSMRLTENARGPRGEASSMPDARDASRRAPAASGTLLRAGPLRGRRQRSGSCAPPHALPGRARSRGARRRRLAPRRAARARRAARRLRARARARGGAAPPEGARGALVLSCRPGAGRVSWRAARGPAPPSPLPFAQYLRAHLVGARLAGARLRDGDRVLGLAFEGRDGGRELVLQLLGPRSNVYLLDGQDRLALSLRPLEETRRDLAGGAPWRAPRERAAAGRRGPLRRRAGRRAPRRDRGALRGAAEEAERGTCAAAWRSRSGASATRSREGAPPRGGPRRRGSARRASAARASS